MPGKAARVTVSERQLSILNELRRSKTESAWVVQRAAIIALAWEGRLNEDISAEIGLGRMDVGKWRWREAWEALTLLECSEPRRLRQAICDTLRDAPRSGGPGKFTAAQMRYLREAVLQPHRRKMWINTTEKDPARFQRQVEEVCQTYQKASGRHAARDDHIDRQLGRAVGVRGRLPHDGPPVPLDLYRQTGARPRLAILYPPSSTWL